MKYSFKSRRPDPWQIYHRQKRQLKPATVLDNVICLIGCAGFIVGLLWIYAMALRGGV